MKLLISFYLTLFLGTAFPNTPTVFVTVAPQKGLVKELAGTMVNVQVLAPNGACPETYAPRPKQVEALSKAEAYFTLGLPFETNWLKKVKFDGTRIHSMSEGIRFRYIRHDHGSNTEHHQEELDPHIWTSIENLITMAKNTKNALLTLVPSEKIRLEKNLSAFIKKALILDKDIKIKFRNMQKKKIYVFHPYYGYFMDSYGLLQAPIEADGKDPSPRQLTKMLDDMKKENVDHVLVQPGFKVRSISALQKLSKIRPVYVSIYSEAVLDNIMELANTCRP